MAEEIVIKREKCVCPICGKVHIKKKKQKAISNERG